MKEKHGFHFGRISIINHWTMAILFISVLSLGFLLDFFGDGRALRGPWMEAHKAGGFILLMFGLWRVSWRLSQGFPKDVVHMPAWQHLSAKLVHWVLLFAMIAMPVSGVLLSLYSERAINVFGLFIVPAQGDNELISRFASMTHELLAYAVAATIFMHVGAVLKHHVLDRDETLARMLRVRKGPPAKPALKQRPVSVSIGGPLKPVAKGPNHAIRKAPPAGPIRTPGTRYRKP